jgi:Kef-type K+ transport system membrane component KefB
VLTTTSLGLVMPAIKEAGIQKSPFGQSILIAASLADFLTLFGITFFILWRDYGLGWHFITPLPLIIGFGIILWAGRLWAWWNPERAERFLGSQDVQELGVRLSVAFSPSYSARRGSWRVNYRPWASVFSSQSFLSTSGWSST